MQEHIASVVLFPFTSSETWDFCNNENTACPYGHAARHTGARSLGIPQTYPRVFGNLETFAATKQGEIRKRIKVPHLFGVSPKGDIYLFMVLARPKNIMSRKCLCLLYVRQAAFVKPLSKSHGSRKHFEVRPKYKAIQGQSISCLFKVGVFVSRLCFLLVVILPPNSMRCRVVIKPPSKYRLSRLVSVLVNVFPTLFGGYTLTFGQARKFGRLNTKAFKGTLMFVQM